jgi:hypothetical protein
MDLSFGIDGEECQRLRRDVRASAAALVLVVARYLCPGGGNPGQRWGLRPVVTYKWLTPGEATAMRRR